jgi:hypothetical protein
MDVSNLPGMGFLKDRFQDATGAIIALVIDNLSPELRAWLKKAVQDFYRQAAKTNPGKIDADSIAAKLVEIITGIQPETENAKTK